MLNVIKKKKIIPSHLSSAIFAEKIAKSAKTDVQKKFLTPNWESAFKNDLESVYTLDGANSHPNFVSLC